MQSHSVSAPRPPRRDHGAAPRPRVAVLYSGRWFGSGNKEIGWKTTLLWAANHLRHLIQPNNASVFIVASPSNWCGPPADARGASKSSAEELFHAEVREAFDGWHDIHTALIPHEEGTPVDGAYAATAMNGLKAQLKSQDIEDHKHYGFVTAMMRNWRWQFMHFQRVEALRRVHGPHDWLVRVRLDVQFVDPLHIRGFPPSDDSGASATAKPLVVPTAKPEVNRDDDWEHRHEKLKDTAAPHADAQPIVHTLYAAGFHAIQPSVLTKEDDVKIIQCKDERPTERSAGRVGSWTREQLGLGQVPSCAAARRRARQNATSSAEQHASGAGGLVWHWRDWLFVGSPEAMAPLARMADRFVLVTANATRCFGLCQEEQTLLQLLQQGVRYAPIGVEVMLDRIACKDGGNTKLPHPMYQYVMEPLQPTEPVWAAPCFACVAWPRSHGNHSGSHGRRLEETSLRRGAWLSSTHDESYGKQFKIKRIGYWGASGRLTRFANTLARKDLDVYEFGVYTGVSMRDIAKRVHGFGHLWGFDSFVGLPQETKGEHLEGSHWKPGGFSAADALGEWKLPALLDQLRETIRYENTSFVPGFYSTSLTSQLRHSKPFQPALLIDVDVDLHSSALECLTWMFEQRLVLPGTTIVRYDDWRNMRQRGGEARAHREVTKRFNVTWRNLAKPGQPPNSREWQVLDYD